MEQIVKRPKKFQSMESLWFESERLATFISWPIKYISVKDLAAEGFYYLRTKDHCACAFCRGIIGAWEEGDTPRGEHKRHFPRCPFVNGKVTPNVPLNQGLILSKLNVENIEENLKSEDVCGTGKSRNTCVSVKTPNEAEEISLKSLGFREYSGPKRKDYITPEARLRSFKHWPEEIKQKPDAMVEAGFFYCGLSDHVRCFHCGNGLRNWEEGDEPWIEHARWYPDCNYVSLIKGIEFIDKVRREKPPYIPSHSTISASSCKNVTHLSDDELEQLLDLHIMKAVLKMGFDKNIVKTALTRRLKQTGLPFYSLEDAIEAVLSVMGEETKKTVQGCEEITSQARKIANIGIGTGSNDVSTSTLPSSQSQSTTPTSEDISVLPILPNNNSTEDISQEIGEDVVEETSTALPQLPNSTLGIRTSEQGGFLSASPPLRASTPTSQIENVSQPMDDEPTNNDRDLNNSDTSLPSSSQSNDSMEVSPDASERMTTCFFVNESNGGTTRTQPLLNEADVVMEKAERLLAPPKTQPPQTTSSCSSNSSQSLCEKLSQDSGICTEKQLDSQPTSSDEEQEKEKVNSKRSVDAENLAMELEKIKETRMCRVCMDKDMDVVFVPCTHMVACSSCAVALSACPICRRDIQYALKPIIT